MEKCNIAAKSKRAAGTMGKERPHINPQHTTELLFWKLYGCSSVNQTEAGALRVGITSNQVM